MSTHILHVEDESQLRNIFAVVLRATAPGVNLVQLRTGDEALNYIEDNKTSIDLFVLDIRLPGSMDGLQVAHKIREWECPGFIIITSAYTPPKVEVLTELRAEYLPKPWHIRHLVNNLLEYRLDSLKPRTSLLTKGPGRETVSTKLPNTLLSSIANSGQPYPAVAANSPELRQTTIPGQQAVSIEINQRRLILPEVDAVIVGRSSFTISDEEGTLDLSDFQAMEKGVSRRHLKLSRKENHLYATDLYSSNGTWLNGKSLVPGKDYLLSNQDELLIGTLMIKVRF
ncbi:MAG: response regulator [Chloroflexota bacterium]